MVGNNFFPGSNNLKFDDVVGVILSEEMQRKITCETSGNSLTIERRRRQKERGRIPGNRINYRKGRSKSIFGKLECWNCGKK